MTLLKRNPGAAIDPKLHNNSFFWGSIYAKFVNLLTCFIVTNFSAKLYNSPYFRSFIIH